MSGARALVVGVSQHESDQFAALPGADTDADRVSAFLRDPSRGGLSDVQCLKSPPIGLLSDTLATVAKAAGENRELLFVYFSGHGSPVRSDGIQLVCLDTRPQNMTFSAFSVRQFARLLAEHNVAASVLVLDTCYAGAFAAGAADVALNQIWLDDSTLADGHFILAACGPTETSRENVGGGKFTSLLLDQVDTIGRERASESSISIETLASALVSSSTVIGQKPIWTGLSVSKAIPFCRNPFWDAGAHSPPVGLSLAAISDADRKKLAGIGRSYVAPMLHVGMDREWAAETQKVFVEVANTDATPSGKAVMTSRLADAIANRVSAYGHIDDQLQLIEVVPAGVVALGSCGAHNCEEIRALAYHLVQLVDDFQTYLQSWVGGRLWKDQSDGPASIALAPIRFWDVLGAGALLALACSALGLAEKERRMANQIVEILQLRTTLHRVEWMGQYPDISAVLGYACWLNGDSARATAERLLENYISRARQGRLPTPASEPPSNIGLDLARNYLGPSGLAPQGSDRVADEGPALFLLALANAGESATRLNGHVAALTQVKGVNDYCLYVPETVAAQCLRLMKDCTIHEWVRSSVESSAKMLADMVGLATHPLDLQSPSLKMDCFTSLAAARLFRNRSCFWVGSVLSRRPAV